MKKVFQTRVNNIDGDCMRASIASLLNLSLNQVPDFINHTDPNYEMFSFLRGYGYNPGIYDKPGEDSSYPSLQQIAEYDGGVFGYFYATVYSPTFGAPHTHAVIVNIDLQVIHDPNPNGRALKLEPEDVIQILLVNKSIYIDADGIIREI